MSWVFHVQVIVDRLSEAVIGGDPETTKPARNGFPLIMIIDATGKRCNVSSIFHSILSMGRRIVLRPIWKIRINNSGTVATLVKRYWGIIMRAVFIVPAGRYEPYGNKL